MKRSLRTRRRSRPKSHASDVRLPAAASFSSGTPLLPRQRANVQIASGSGAACGVGAGSQQESSFDSSQGMGHVLPDALLDRPAFARRRVA
jgi:hypothetical protein